jgi:hypothetical protein
METKTQLNTSTIIPLRQGGPANDNHPPISIRRSILPKDAIGHTPKAGERPPRTLRDVLETAGAMKLDFRGLSKCLAALTII